jgi:anoctamin-8
MMGIIACLVNCALIGLSGQVDRMFPNITTNQTIILIVLLEVLSKVIEGKNRFVNLCIF